MLFNSFLFSLASTFNVAEIDYDTTVWRILPTNWDYLFDVYEMSINDRLRRNITRKLHFY